MFALLFRDSKSRRFTIPFSFFDLSFLALLSEASWRGEASRAMNELCLALLADYSYLFWAFLDAESGYFSRVASLWALLSYALDFAIFVKLKPGLIGLATPAALFSCYGFLRVGVALFEG